jgi:hypothetical protein
VDRTVVQGSTGCAYAELIILATQLQQCSFGQTQCYIPHAFCLFCLNLASVTPSAQTPQVSLCLHTRSSGLHWVSVTSILPPYHREICGLCCVPDHTGLFTSEVTDTFAKEVTVHVNLTPDWAVWVNGDVRVSGFLSVLLLWQDVCTQMERNKLWAGKLSIRVWQFSSSYIANKVVIVTCFWIGHACYMDSGRCCMVNWYLFL